MPANCPICDQPARTLAELKAGFAACRCGTCTAVFADPMPSNEDLERYYSAWLFALPTEARVDQWRGHTAGLADTMVADLSRRLGRPVRRMLDFGGGLGFFARGFADHVEHSAIFDMSAASLDYARSTFGDRIAIHDSADGALDAGPYDAIVVNQVIEHVPDPTAFLHSLRRGLAPDGLLVVSTPNNAMADPLFRRDLLRRYASLAKGGKRAALTAMVRDSWVGLEPPRHLFAFNDRSLAEAALRAGYGRSEVRSHAFDADPLGYPVYQDEKRDMRSRLFRWQRRIGKAVVTMVDPKHRRRNTLVGIFRPA